MGERFMASKEIPDDMRFAERLTHYRQRLGLTQHEIANRARELLTGGQKLGRASISRYEAGANMPKRDVIHALAKVLGVTPEELSPRRGAPLIARHIKPATDVPVSLAVESTGDMARLTINDVKLPFELAIEILTLIKPYYPRAVPTEPAPVEKKES